MKKISIFVIGSIFSVSAVANEANSPAMEVTFDTDHIHLSCRLRS